MPEKLKSLKQWVVWRYEHENGRDKPAKVPYSPHSLTRATVRDMRTWGSFDTATHVPGFDGIGFVLTAHEEIVFVDLDHCRDAETGKVEEWAQRVIEKLNSYTEISPSGTGLHVFLEAKLAEGKRKGQIEVYASGRYATITGNHVPGTPLAIEQRQVELEAVLEEYFTRAPATAEPAVSVLGDEAVRNRALQADPAAFFNLWMGDTKGYDSMSEADFALCCMLARFTRSTEQIERIVSQSALSRDKWEREDYLHRTIDRALQATTSKEMSDTVRLSDVKAESVRWLWPGRILLGKLNILDGDPGLGKTCITLDIAARVSAYKPMPDGNRGNLDGPAGVLLLMTEDDLADTIRPRLDAAGADVTRIAAFNSRSFGRIPTIADLLWLREQIAAVEAKLVIIDPLVTHLPSRVDAHKDQDVRSALAPLAALAADTGTAILMVRHLNKGSGSNALYRGGGSIGILGIARSGMLVAKDPEDDERRILAMTKHNLAAHVSALAYRIVAHEDTDIPRIQWEGPEDLQANELLDTESKSTGREFDRAVEFLTRLLASGPIPATEVQGRAKAEEISNSTLRRARGKLGLRVRKDGTCWMWELKTTEWRTTNQ